MAQPHPSQLFKPTTRPCWHCGTQHESNTIPALCSAPCHEAWQRLYQLQYGEPSAITPPPAELGFTDEVGTRHSVTLPEHTNHGCNIGHALNEHDRTVLRQLGTTVATATAGLDALKVAVRSEQELMNAESLPLGDDGLDRHRAVLQGAPMSALHDPDWRPADEPQDLVDSGSWVGVALQPKRRLPWWRRWLRRG